MFAWADEILAGSRSGEGIIFLLLMGGFAFHQAIKLHKRVRKIQDTPRSKAQSAAQGLTELEGFAWTANDSLFTIEQKEAVYYDFQLQKLVSKGSGKNRRNEWETVSKMELKKPFYLCDATGLVLIDPQACETDFIQSITKNWNALSKEQKEFVQGHLVTERVAGFPPLEKLWGLFGAKFRVIENFIQLGNPLYVTGDFRSDSGLQEAEVKGVREFQKLVYDPNTKALKNQMVLLDKNGDKKISQEELVSGYTFAADLAIRKSADLQDEAPLPIHGQIKGSDVHKLYIAGSHEKVIVEKLKYQPLWYLLGGAACLALAIGQLLPKDLFKRSYHQLDISSLSQNTRQIGSQEELQALHQACVANSRKACQKLLSQKQELGLSQEHIQYYRSRACALGDTTHCY